MGWLWAGRDDDERRARPTDEQTSSGCRPVLSEIVRNFRPDTGPKGSISALTATVPQRARRVTRRAGAQRRTAQPLTRPDCGGYPSFFRVRADFQQ